MELYTDYKKGDKVNFKIGFNDTILKEGTFERKSGVDEDIVIVIDTNGKFKYVSIYQIYKVI